MYSTATGEEAQLHVPAAAPPSEWSLTSAPADVFKFDIRIWDGGAGVGRLEG